MLMNCWWLCLWPSQLFFLISQQHQFEAEAKPMLLHQENANAAAILEVSVGETAKLSCPSNDDNHRFQFWQLKSNEILGPGNRINQRKYKYEVLSGTLYIKGVSLDERGVYTCYCKHLTKTAYNAKSIMLLVKSDWDQLWENDEVNFFRFGVLLVVAALIMMVIYVIYNNLKRDQLMQFKDFTNENILDEVSCSRKASYSVSKNGSGSSSGLKKGIDNPALDVQFSSRESTPTYGGGGGSGSGYTSRTDSRF